MMYAFSAEAKIDCNKHRLFCSIKKIRPDIDSAYAMQLSNYIHRASLLYKVDGFRVIAIMAQESSINPNARNIKTTTTTHKECDERERCVTTVTTISETTDFGLFQFNIFTMKHYNLNIERIMTDTQFVVDFAVKMIADKISLCKKKYPKTAWACYHSATPERHKEYVNLVNAFYYGINK